MPSNTVYVNKHLYIYRFTHSYIYIYTILYKHRTYIHSCVFSYIYMKVCVYVSSCWMLSRNLPSRRQLHSLVSLKLNNPDLMLDLTKIILVDCVLWNINPCRLFIVKPCSCIHIKNIFSPDDWSCRIYRVHPKRGVRHPPTGFPDRPLNYLIQRLQSWSFGNMEYPFIAPRFTWPQSGSTWEDPIYGSNRTVWILNCVWINDLG